MAPWTRALRIAAKEGVLLAATLLAIVATVVTTQADDPAEIVWVMALAVMSVPYASAVTVALGSTVKLGRPVLAPQRPVAQAMDQQKMDLAA